MATEVTSRELQSVGGIDAAPDTRPRPLVVVPALSPAFEGPVVEWQIMPDGDVPSDPSLEGPAPKPDASGEGSGVLPGLVS